MKAIEFEGQTVLLAPPNNWNNDGDLKCGSLPVKVGNVGGFQCFVSYWRPTQEEMTALSDGAHVRLVVFGGTHPPVDVLVEAAKELP